jgi:hypothetical protein
VLCTKACSGQTACGPRCRLSQHRSLLRRAPQPLELCVLCPADVHPGKWADGPFRMSPWDVSPRPFMAHFLCAADAFYNRRATDTPSRIGNWVV